MPNNNEFLSSEKDPSLKTIYKATPKERQRDKHKEKHKGENKEKEN